MSQAPASSRRCVLCGSGPRISPFSPVPAFPATPRGPCLPLSTPATFRLPLPQQPAAQNGPHTVHEFAYRCFRFFKIRAGCQYLKIKTCTGHGDICLLSQHRRVRQPQACIFLGWRLAEGKILSRTRPVPSLLCSPPPHLSDFIKIRICHLCPSFLKNKGLEV